MINKPKMTLLIDWYSYVLNCNAGVSNPATWTKASLTIGPGGPPPLGVHEIRHNKIFKGDFNVNRELAASLVIT